MGGGASGGAGAARVEDDRALTGCDLLAQGLVGGEPVGGGRRGVGHRVLLPEGGG